MNASTQSDVDPSVENQVLSDTEADGPHGSNENSFIAAAGSGHQDNYQRSEKKHFSGKTSSFECRREDTKDSTELDVDPSVENQILSDAESDVPQGSTENSFKAAAGAGHQDNCQRSERKHFPGKTSSCIFFTGDSDRATSTVKGEEEREEESLYPNN